MSWTYDTSLSTNKDKVRLKIMDTDTSSQLFSDEEINALLNDTAQDVTLTAYKLARSLAYKYARSAVSKRAGPYSEDTTARARLYFELAGSLADEADEPWEEIAEMPSGDPRAPYQSEAEQEFIARDDARNGI